MNGMPTVVSVDTSISSSVENGQSAASNHQYDYPPGDNRVVHAPSTETASSNNVSSSSLKHETSNAYTQQLLVNDFLRTRKVYVKDHSGDHAYSLEL